GVHRLGRDPIEGLGRITHPLGDAATDLEVKLRVLLPGHVPVHLLDRALELPGVDERRSIRLRERLGLPHLVRWSRFFAHLDLVYFNVVTKQHNRDAKQNNEVVALRGLPDTLDDVPPVRARRRPPPRLGGRGRVRAWLKYRSSTSRSDADQFASRMGSSWRGSARLGKTYWKNLQCQSRPYLSCGNQLRKTGAQRGEIPGPMTVFQPSALS